GFHADSAHPVSGYEGVFAVLGHINDDLRIFQGLADGAADFVYLVDFVAIDFLDVGYQAQMRFAGKQHIIKPWKIERLLGIYGEPHEREGIILSTQIINRPYGAEGFCSGRKDFYTKYIFALSPCSAVKFP